MELEDMLSQLYADEQVLRAKTRSAALHASTGIRTALERQEEDIDRMLSHIARCIILQGGRVPATLREFLTWTQLADMEADVATLVADHELLMCALRERIERTQDETVDALLRDLLQLHIEMSCTLRSMLRDCIFSISVAS